MDDVLRFYSAQTRPGAGYLGGDTPDGITTINNVPVAGAVIDVFIRDTHQWIRQTDTNHFGEWRIGGLPADIAYDIVARYPGKADLIKGNVTPYTYDGPLFVYNSFDHRHNNATEYSVLCSLVSGTPPYTIVDFTLPAGLTAAIEGNLITITGTSGMSVTEPCEVQVSDNDNRTTTHAFSLTTYSESMFTPVAVTSSSNYGGPLTATIENMSDDNVATVTGWGSGTTAFEWVMLDLGSAMPVNRIIIGGGSVPGFGNVSSYANNVTKVEMSTDGVTWTDVIPNVDGIVDNPPELRDKLYTIATTVGRYVRYIRKTNGWGCIATFRAGFEG